MFEFIKNIKISDIGNYAGIGVGTGEATVGEGIESIGRAIKNDGLRRKFRNRAELFIRHEKFTAASLHTFYFHNRACAVEALMEELMTAAENGTEVTFLTDEQAEELGNEFITELEQNPTA